MSAKVVLEWTSEKETELNGLAKEYCDIDNQIKILTEKKSALKDTIGKIMTDYAQKKVITEGYSVGYTHVAGSRSFDSAKAKAKLIELNIDLDDSFYKIGKSYDRLDISKKEILDSESSDDPHRVKVSLDDLKI